MNANNNAIDMNVATEGTIVRRFLDRGFKAPTEVDLAELFVDVYRDRLRWVRQPRNYFAWDGARWRSDEAGDLALKAVQNLYRLLIAEAAATAIDDETRTRIFKWALAISSDSVQRAVLRQAAPALAVDIGAFDRDPFVLNVPNGTIDLRTGELRPHNPDDMISKVAPVAYDPDATCPRFELFLREIFIDANGKPNEDLIEFAQRMLGYALTGDASEECIFVWHGEGSNGKSKLIEVFNASIMGEYARTVDVATFAQLRRDGNAPSPDVARLVGARLVTTSEPPQGIRLNEGFLKSVTGRDVKAARFLHKNVFEFTPTFKVMLATNYKPEIRSTDYGTWRRIRLLPFLAKFVEGVNRDERIGEKLKAEALGILAWAVRGCLAWLHEGGLRPPPIIASATAAYQAEMSIVRRFVADICVLIPAATVNGPALYAAYEQWCKDTGERFPLPRRGLFAELRKQFGNQISERKINGQVAFRGVGLRGDHSDERAEIDEVDEVDEDSHFTPIRVNQEKPDPSSTSPTSSTGSTSWSRRGRLCSICHQNVIVRESDQICRDCIALAGAP